MSGGYSNKRRGRPGEARMGLTRPIYTQRHYEGFAELFRVEFQKHPAGTPEHAGICLMMATTIGNFRRDNPRFHEFEFIQWVNTP